ncbi:elongation of very long chain fatty acids protein 6-like, partial [Centruroides sculpturatus]|uniref:elongation of very long chain fatty acids protein 6-like n=1 Tax=Centruroides sculpturatus TaxID=218467 RepID=UPI000C6E88B4
LIRPEMKSFNLTESHLSNYGFEAIINNEDMKTFFKRYWHYSIYVSFIYLSTVCLLREYMKFRPAYDLRRTSIIWNGFLAIYSIISVLRCLPAVYYYVTRYSFYQIVCDKSLIELRPETIFWIMLFSLSKVWELGDTLLIVLRKRKLMFLHWYHHVATLIAIWYTRSKEGSFGICFGFMNIVVHSFMYSYFALKYLNVKIPVKISMFITAIQTLQMLFGVLLSFWVYWLLINGYKCDTSKDNLEFMFLIRPEMKSFNLTESHLSNYGFEAIINNEDMKTFFKRYWHYSIYVSFIYLSTVCLLREYMKFRPAYDLRRTSIIWNGFLAIYSIISVLRCLPAVYYYVTRYSFYQIVCDKSLIELRPETIFWIMPRSQQ